MTRRSLCLSSLALSMGLAFAAQAQERPGLSGQSEALARMAADTGITPAVVLHDSTGAARFVRLPRSDATARMAAQGRSRPMTDALRHDGSVQFLRAYGGLFGIRSVDEEIGPGRITKDRQGGTHISHKQFYRGLPVFGAELKTHYDAADNLVVANGTFVPGITVDPKPDRSAEEAGKLAVARIAASLGRPAKLAAAKPTLMIYRAGLAQGIEGANHLAWEVVVGNGVDVRDFVYVDAHTGKVIDKISGIHDAKHRRAYNGQGATAPGPNYPAAPFWVEGQAFPTGTTEADNMIAASSEIYDLFKNAFGRDSFDGQGATMDSVFNRGNACPNASWNGTFISFCPGLTTDDITAHEWGHAYTEYTHGLIYAWQPGALNEAYSDIWGETVDRINGRGGDTPDALRTPGACTTSTPTLPTINITAPASIAGVKSSGTATFGPQTFSVASTVVVVNDGAGTASDGCETPFVNAAAVSGKIAYVDRGACSFAVKTKNAQLNGAIGVIIGNNAAGTAAPAMSGADATITIPALSLNQGDGTAIKALTGVSTITASMFRGGKGSDSSVRWLLGEDSTANGSAGALRDMYTPTCYGNPGKVSDGQYSCGPNSDAGDSGGVHTNSGVANHGYALLVDGGSYNGQNISAIGLTKAAHLYFRAQSVYQSPASNFADHADALEQSCRDLTGQPLADLKTGAIWGDLITASDCAQVAKMALAVELRTPPSQCNFQPLLAKSPPALCPTGAAAAVLTDGFDGGKRGGVKWLVTHVGATGDFTARDWGVVTNLPGKRAGYAIYAADTNAGTCQPGGDQTGLQRLESPEIMMPADATAPRLTFDHWVSTEASVDGGNVKISVNGGGWQLVKAADFIYNAYNTTLATAAVGNTNPLAGEPAFTGGDGGSVTGSWGRSIVNLSPYARPGDKVKLRFELGNDGCGGAVGWYLDDVMVYRCTP
ncbi:M4 family metallopeptidase [Roseateles sp.]|uniref:M4 family metallopeptidase n=1 Tax=Roseateles sp. TaxID=1971397 RepID=UPI003267E89B